MTERFFTIMAEESVAATETQGVNPVAIIIAVVLVALIGAGVLLYYAKKRETTDEQPNVQEDSSQSNFIPVASVPSEVKPTEIKPAEVVKPVQTKEAVLQVVEQIINKPAEKVKVEPASKPTESMVVAKEEEKLPWSFDSFVLCRKKDGKMAKIVRVYPEDGYAVVKAKQYEELPLEQITQFIGNDSAYQMLKCEQCDRWLFTDGKSFYFTVEAKVVGKAKLTDKSKSIDFLKTGDKFTDFEGNEIATFMVVNAGTLLCQMTNGDYGPYEITKPVVAAGVTFMRAGDFIVAYSSLENKLEIYDSSMKLLAL